MNLATVRIVWSTVLSSTFIELAIVLWSDFDRHVRPQVEVVLSVVFVAVGCVVLGVGLPGRLHQKALASLALPVAEAPTGEAGRDYRTASQSRRVFSDPVTARFAALRTFHAPFILGLALAETVAVLGVVVALGRLAPSAYALPFFPVAWLMIGARFPRERSILGPAERVYDAVFP